MKFQKLFVFFPMLAVLSCGSDDNVNPTAAYAGISNYQFYYVDFPAGTPRTQDNTIDVVYNGDKIVKLNGGFSKLDQASGYEYYFDKRNHRDISYETNAAIVVEKVSTGVSSGYEQRIEFTYDGKLKRKIRLTPDYINFRDTINYFYENEVLKSFERRSVRLVERSEIYYNNAADVDSIVTRFPTYTTSGEPFFDPESKDRKVLYFENFDAHPNPFLKFVLFDDTFNRALSAHNYSKIRKVTYDYDGHIIGDTFTEWTFIRENGIINFGR